ncbi:MAG: esterase/lipase family protein [Planctomycetota bacterium]|jgi:pimeloyl-ACP methyl ester carboxylesterase
MKGRLYCGDSRRARGEGDRYHDRLVRARRFNSLSSLLAMVALASGGCLHTPGPSISYPVASAVVDSEYQRMKEQPAALTRPLLVIDGWLPMGAWLVGGELKRLTRVEPDQFQSFSYTPGSSIDHLANRVVRRVEATWPSDDPEWTREIDVVGFSMGGIIARAAALPTRLTDSPRKRLRIRTLYTISTPHQGTVGIALAAPDGSSRDVTPRSEMLTFLDEALPDLPYELVCYGHESDLIVGSDVAPRGFDLFLTPPPLPYSHITAAGNRRILADIALRLRGEPPLTEMPADATVPAEAERSQMTP